MGEHRPFETQIYRMIVNLFLSISLISLDLCILHFTSRHTTSGHVMSRHVTSGQSRHVMWDDVTSLHSTSLYSAPFYPLSLYFLRYGALNLHMCGIPIGIGQTITWQPKLFSLMNLLSRLMALACWHAPLGSAVTLTWKPGMYLTKGLKLVEISLL